MKTKTSKLIVIIVLLIIGAALIVYFIRPAKTAPPAPENTNTQAAIPPTTYTASVDGFSADFTGTPQVTTSTYSSPTAGTIPVTKYEFDDPSNPVGAHYSVYVFHYPTTYAFENGYLATALQSFSKELSASYPGATITGSTQTVLAGNPALLGTISIPVKSGSITDKLLISTHGHNSYIFNTYGGSVDADYAAFVQSFNFTN